MTDVPSWLNELVAVSDVFAREHQEELARWGSDPDDPTDQPPLTTRTANLARAFAAHAGEFSASQREAVFGLLERVMRTGTQQDRDVIATGFFEALLSAWDEGFDLHSVWALVGSDSRKYCLAWNDFNGIESPDWMRN